MRRDWDVIREVLIEVEALSDVDRHRTNYSLRDEQTEAEQRKSEQALLLWKADFIEAIDASTKDGSSIQSPNLTWKGHELLDTLRRKPVWEEIKRIAKEKGIELTFDAVKMLAKVAMSKVIGS